MPFLLLEKTALDYSESETIHATHNRILRVYEDTGRGESREQQGMYTSNVGFIYRRGQLQDYVRKHKTLPELDQNGNTEKPPELTETIQKAQAEFGNDLVAGIGEWPARVPQLIKRCYAPYDLYARRERREEVQGYIQEMIRKERLRW